MNERIKELMVELKKTVSTHRGDAVLIGYDEIEKFAELIVRECCLVLEQTETALDRHKWPSPSECGVYIKEHFGVEE